MQTETNLRNTSSSAFGWSNRITLAALAGILFLTLFPFRLDLHSGRASGVAPLLLERSVKISGPLDIFLNVLLFVPFGFGICAKLRGRGFSRLRAALLATGLSALLSYSIELAQIYIPGRDSGWEDVFTNSLGSLVGSIVYHLWAPGELPYLSAFEVRLERWILLRRTVWILAVYFAFWFALSVPLQRQTRLGPWDLSARLFIGNDASGHYPWKGQLSLVQFWNHAVPTTVATQATSAHSLNPENLNEAASYFFNGPAAPPYRDSRALLPPLQWPKQTASLSADPRALVLDNDASLASQGSAAALVIRIERSNQFSVHVLCTPTRTEQNATILSIGPQSGLANLNLRQQGSDLVFWFRNGLSRAGVYHLALHAPDVFQENQPRDILYSYNGSTLSLYIDGHQQPHIYQLSPGAALAHLIGRSKMGELTGYKDIYYAILFLPAGFLTGLLARKRPQLPALSLYALLVFSALMVPFGLDALLAHISERNISLANILLPFAVVVAGWFWINSDRSSSRGTPQTAAR